MTNKLQHYPRTKERSKDHEKEYPFACRSAGLRPSRAEFDCLRGQQQVRRRNNGRGIQQRRLRLCAHGGARLDDAGNCRVRGDEIRKRRALHDDRGQAG